MAAAAANLADHHAAAADPPLFCHVTTFTPENAGATTTAVSHTTIFLPPFAPPFPTSTCSDAQPFPSTPAPARNHLQIHGHREIFTFSAPVPSSSPQFRNHRSTTFEQILMATAETSAHHHQQISQQQQHHTKPPLKLQSGTSTTHQRNLHCRPCHHE